MKYTWKHFKGHEKAQGLLFLFKKKFLLKSLEWILHFSLLNSSVQKEICTD